MPSMNYQSTGALAAQLGIPRWRLAYLIEHGDLPGPSIQVAGRRVFSDADVERIRAALAKRGATRRRRKDVAKYPDTALSREG
jgi:hypothetical protein